MAERRSALIIANSEYEDAGLQKLAAPTRDAEALQRVLADPELGGFDVETLLNRPAREVNVAVEKFFLNRKRDDLLLLYYSGHGLRDDDGQLYLTAADTQLIEGIKPLRATALSAGFVKDVMRSSSSRRQVLVLDCCYSGAFARALVSRGTPVLTIQDQFEEGRGLVLLTASTAVQPSFEEGPSAPSIFTRHLVQGVETGDADGDGDGLISLDELYEYVHNRVTDENPQQRPMKWAFDVEGEIVIAQVPKAAQKPVELPPDLQQAIESRFPALREDAVRELDLLLRGKHRGRALAAREALWKLKDDDSRRVARAAEQCLAAYDEQERQFERDRLERERETAEAAERERQRKEQAEQERLAREAVEQERLRAEAERAAQQKAEQERQERERTEAAERERQAKERAEQERLARERAEAERRAAEEAAAKRAAQQKADQERQALAKAEAERITREKAELERGRPENAKGEEAWRARVQQARLRIKFLLSFAGLHLKVVASLAGILVVASGSLWYVHNRTSSVQTALVTIPAPDVPVSGKAVAAKPTASGSTSGTGPAPTEASSQPGDGKPEVLSSRAAASAPRDIDAKTDSAAQKPVSQAPGTVGGIPEGVPTGAADEAAISKGDSYYAKGAYDQALRAYQNGLNLDPENPNLLSRIERTRKKLVVTLVKQSDSDYENGQYDQAIGQYQRALALDPNNQEIVQKLNKTKNAKDTVDLLLKRH